MIKVARFYARRRGTETFVSASAAGVYSARFSSVPANACEGGSMKGTFGAVLVIAALAIVPAAAQKEQT
jgi:hypothetical protein